MKELLEEEVVNCTTSLEREELNKWLPDQDKNETEIQQTGSQKAVSCQANSYSSTDDMLNYFFEMMHMSPDLFSLSLSRAKGVCPDTPCLYSSPKLLKGESHSWCSKHFSRKWTRYHCLLVLIIRFSLLRRRRFAWLKRTWCVLSHKPAWFWKQVCPERWTGY